MKALYLLDTNVISEFAKKIPNEHVLERYYANETRCAIPAVVWQELIYGLEKMPEGKRRCIVADAIENLRSHNERDFAALCKISMLKIEDWAR